ncbi:DUF3817 domain-containing protein [Fibrella sp. WM1]|uniref:DUF3817 domain-containing protein n=1 Tax=Fibrella musci TaxID=3242485 RepID=UPI00352270AC
MFFTSPKLRLRVASMLEGTSLLVLFLVGVPMKHLYQQPGVVQAVGPIHGLLFVWYALTVIQAKTEYRWPLGKTLLALIASFVPGGTFYADHVIFRKLREQTQEP